MLYTNIGRGHPHYLDGIIEALIRSQALGLVRREFDVFELSRGLSRLSWRAAAWMYRHGASPFVRPFYRRVRARNDYNRDTALLRVMGRGLREFFDGDPDPVLVAHPTLVGLLAGKSDLIYQHGEVVTPPEALVRGASTVLVPTPEAAEPFVSAGYDREQVVTTGLCIEPALVRQAADAFTLRLERFGRGEILSGAFFSSGAEPAGHVRRLVSAAFSALQGGSRVIVFGRRGGRLAGQAAVTFTRRGIPFATMDTTAPLSGDLPAALIVTFNNRREENILTARLFPLFDYVVAPPHERTNWGLGLGLPMFLVGPDVGPFAPLNRAVLHEAGVADDLDAPVDSHLFGARVRRLQGTDQLTEMARRGWGKREINGFGRIAAFLVSKYAATDV